MSDAAPIPGAPPEKLEDSQSAPESGFLADPVVRGMVFAAIGLMIVFLATVIGVMVTGVASPTGPRSAAERQLMIAASTAASSTAAAKAPYIEALANDGNLTAARVALAQARASLPATAPVSRLDLAEARLLALSGDAAKAVTLADSAMKGYVAEHAALVAKAAETSSTPPSATYNSNYYDAALVKAYALVKLSRFKEAVAAFDIYIRVDSTASDILIDRANAKLALGDKAGAERDFRAALKYVPYDEEAKAGLKKMGVAQ